MDDPEVIAQSIAAVRMTSCASRAEAWAKAIQSGASPERRMEILCGSDDSPEDVAAREARHRELLARPTPVIARPYPHHPLIPVPPPTHDVLAVVRRLVGEGRATMRQICIETERTPEQVKAVLNAAGFGDLIL